MFFLVCKKTLCEFLDIPVIFLSNLWFGTSMNYYFSKIMAKILLNLLINMYNFFEIRKKTLKLALKNGWQPQWWASEMGLLMGCACPRSSFFQIVLVNVMLGLQVWFWSFKHKHISWCPPHSVSISVEFILFSET